MLSAPTVRHNCFILPRIRDHSPLLTLAPVDSIRLYIYRQVSAGPGFSPPPPHETANMISLPSHQERGHAALIATNLRRLMARHGMTYVDVVEATGLDERTIRGL